MDSLQVLFSSPAITVDTLINGLLAGAVLALAAYGMALVWGVMNIINVVQGEFVILGGYVLVYLANDFPVWIGIPAMDFDVLWIPFLHFSIREIPFLTFLKPGINPFWGLPAAVIFLYGVGWATYRIVIFRIVDRDLFISILATFGVSILLQQLLNLIFLADIQTVPSRLATWTFADNQITIAQIKVVNVAMVFLVGAGLVFFLKSSRLGRAIRATAQNARAARIMGVDTDQVYATTYALNAAICGAAGALVVMTWVIHPFLGILYTVRSFLIVVVAGLGNLAGVAVAGLGLGAAETFAAFILGAEFQAAFVYLLMVVILIWRNCMLAKQRRYLK